VEHLIWGQGVAGSNPAAPTRTARSVTVRKIANKSERLGPRMSVARIYKPAKTAMQSGARNTKAWVLDYEPAEPRDVEPLMGWTSSGDMRQQLRLRFHTN